MHNLIRFPLNLFVLDENECSSTPCLNNAECTNTFGSYYCTCAFGYQGENCSGRLGFLRVHNFAYFYMSSYLHIPYFILLQQIVRLASMARIVCFYSTARAVGHFWREFLLKPPLVYSWISALPPFTAPRPHLACNWAKLEDHANFRNLLWYGARYRAFHFLIPT